jgi:hypothetical protein
MSPSQCLHVARIPQKKNGTNEKWQLPFVCLLQTEKGNDAANGNGKLKFVSLVGK